MKIMAQTNALNEAMGLVGSIVATRTPKPVLECVKLIAADGVLTLLATDLEVGCRYQLGQVEIVEEGERFLEVELTGPGPYWIAFTGASETAKRRSKPNGYRALIVRQYEAVIGGKTYVNPILSAPVHKSDPANLDIELLPPAGIRFRHPRTYHWDRKPTSRTCFAVWADHPEAPNIPCRLFH